MRSLETESRMMVVGGGGNEERVSKGSRVSVWGDEKLLKMDDDDDGCTII